MKCTPTREIKIRWWCGVDMVAGRVGGGRESEPALELRDGTTSRTQRRTTELKSNIPTRRAATATEKCRLRQKRARHRRRFLLRRHHRHPGSEERSCAQTAANATEQYNTGSVKHSKENLRHDVRRATKRKRTDFLATRGKILRHMVAISLRHVWRKHA